MNELMRLEPLVGDWDVTLTHAWFLDSLDTEIHGTATIEWYAAAFVLLRSTWQGRTAEQGGSAWAMAFSRNDPRDTFVALYHDDRGVSRVFDVTFAAGEWTLLREDPDRCVDELGHHAWTLVQSVGALQPAVLPVDLVHPVEKPLERDFRHAGGPLAILDVDQRLGRVRGGMALERSRAGQRLGHVERPPARHCVRLA